MKPILFNTEMVKALFDGRKTVTRRIMKPQPVDSEDCNHEMVTFNDMLPGYYDGDYTCACRNCGYGIGPSGESVFKPPYIPGDILYVRETWNKVKLSSESEWHYEYRASCENPAYFSNGFMAEWRPSIHMPKEAARLFLRVTHVRVERLRDITTTGLQNEGIIPNGYISQYSCMTEFEYWFDRFKALWDSTIKPVDLEKYGWDANPWVWVIEFERCEKTEVAQRRLEEIKEN